MKHIKVAIYNIYLTVWFLITGSGGSCLFYQGLKHFNEQFSVIVKMFFVLFAILILAVTCVFLYKLKFIIIYKNRITAWSVFRFNITHIDLNNVQILTWGYWSNKGTYFKTINIKGKDGRIIAFSDFEFENFNSLAKYITEHSKYDMPYTQLVEQAKKNIGESKFVFLVFGVLIILMLYKFQNYSFVQVVILIASLGVLFAALRRWIIYSKWIRYAKQ